MKNFLYILIIALAIGGAFWYWRKRAVAVANSKPSAPAAPVVPAAGPTLSFHASINSVTVSVGNPTMIQNAMNHLVSVSGSAAPAPVKPDYNALSADAKVFMKGFKITTSNAYEIVQLCTWTGIKPPAEKLRIEVDTYLQALAKYNIATYVTGKPHSTYIDYGGGWPKGSKTASIIQTFRETQKQQNTSDIQQQHRAQGGNPSPGHSIQTTH
jgi:hypothetical protein